MFHTSNFLNVSNIYSVLGFDENMISFSSFIPLSHYSPVLLIYTPWKQRFSDVFKGYKKATLGGNGLM